MDNKSNYLPRVIRRAEWVTLDISEKRCDCCEEWPEMHSWGLLSYDGRRIIYCSESPPIAE